MLPQPGFQDAGPTIEQDIDTFMCLGVDEDRRVPAAAEQREVIQTEYPGNRTVRWWQREQYPHRGLPGGQLCQGRQQTGTGTAG